MIDKVNRIFAGLAKPHWIKYVLVFFFIGVVFFSFYPFPKDIKTDFFYHDLYIFALGCFPLCGISCLVFYSVEDRVFLDKRNNGGIPATDTYFYTKINSNISAIKKTFGYAYALLKVFGYGMFWH